MSRKYNYYPRALYQFLNDLAFKNEISIKEVETILLRKKSEEIGFECPHKNIKYAQTTGEPFCNDCWTRMIELEKASYNSQQEVWKPAKVAIKETFLDTEAKAIDTNRKEEQKESEEKQEEEITN